MGYLLDVEWSNGEGLQDLQIWGTDRLMRFLDLFDEAYGQNQFGPEDGYAVFLYYEMKGIIIDMNAAIDRFGQDCDPGGSWARALRRCAPKPENTDAEAEDIKDCFLEMEARKKLTPYQLDQYRQIRDKIMELMEKGGGDMTEILEAVKKSQ